MSMLSLSVRLALSKSGGLGAAVGVCLLTGGIATARSASAASFFADTAEGDGSSCLCSWICVGQSFLEGCEREVGILLEAVSGGAKGKFGES